MDAETQNKIEKTFKALEKEFAASVADLEKRVTKSNRGSAWAFRLIIVCCLGLVLIGASNGFLLYHHFRKAGSWININSTESKPDSKNSNLSEKSLTATSRK